MARIILFGGAVVGVLVAALVWAVISGQYDAAQPGPSASVAASSEPAPSVSPVGSVTGTPSGAASPSAAVSGSATTVQIRNVDFGPDLTVNAGMTVTWMNGDGFAHTATEGSNGVKAPDALFDLQLAGGASASYTFEAVGTYQVTCTLHSNMNMTVTVQ